MKRNALRPVALVVRCALAVSLFSLVVPPLTQATPQHNSHMRHADSSDSIQPDAARTRVTFGAAEALGKSADAKVAGMPAIELSRAPETEYRLIDTKMALADEFPEFQHRRIKASASFTPHAAYSSPSQDWVYPTTCDVRGRNVARPQTRYQVVVLLGYSDHTCADGWKRLPLAVDGRSQRELERRHRFTHREWTRSLNQIATHK